VTNPLAAPRRVWNRVPLRARLVAILLVALLVALVATAAATQAALRGYLVAQVDSQLRDDAVDAAAIAYNPPTNRFGGGPRPLRGYIAEFRTPSGQSRVVPAGAADLPTFPVLSAEDVDARNFQPYSITSPSGLQYRAVALTLIDRQTNDVVAYAQVAYPLTGVEGSVAQLRTFVLGFGGLVVLVCALLGWLAIRRSFAPLVEVEETAAAIAAGDLSRRIPERPASTEVGRLTGSLNGMLTQIESAFRAREASEARTRRFAADASHELRTPLASIRGFAELYRHGAVPPGEIPRTMRRIEDEATRMGGLVEDLLLLARLDERRPARAQPVDLVVLAGDAVHDVRGLDPGRPVRLTGLQPGAGPVPAVVVGDEGGLRQVVTNLVANAVRHTPPGTPVEVAVGVEPGSEAESGPEANRSGRAVLEVRDHGTGLPPEEAGKVFERFYRVDSSRRRGTGGGSGLGLSIVSAVTTAHGGTVDVRTTPGGGATFRVVLPLPATSVPNGRPDPRLSGNSQGEPRDYPARWRAMEPSDDER
jgi:two-component system OmpR family sensor kinase